MVCDAAIDPICTWYAARALGDLEADKFISTLLSIIQKPDVEVGESSVHRISAQSLGKLGRAALQPLLTLAVEAKGDSAVAVADALGELRLPEAIPTLQSFLSSTNHQVAIWSALSLAKIGEAAIPALADTIRGADQRHAMLIADALAKICVPAVFAPLVSVAQSHPEVVLYYVQSAPARGTALISLARDVATKLGPEASDARRLLDIFEATE